MDFFLAFYIINAENTALKISDGLQMPNILLVEYTVVFATTPFRSQVLEVRYSKELSSS